jgi:hypothetical protein
MKSFFMGRLFLLATSLLLVIPSSTKAQDDEVRKSLKASVTQRLGVDTDITIDFSRPGVKGRKIWGDLVPYGMYPGIEYSNPGGPEPMKIQPLPLISQSRWKGIN